MNLRTITQISESNISISIYLVLTSIYLLTYKLQAIITMTCDIVNHLSEEVSASKHGAKKNKRVSFSEGVTPILAASPEAQAQHDDCDYQIKWYTCQQQANFRTKAKELAERLRERQPTIVEEVKAALEVVKLQAQSQQPIDTSSKTLLFKNWSKLGASRRGLERYVLTHKERKARNEDLKASRSVVLNLQCLLNRTAQNGADQEQAQTMIRTQYQEFSRHAVILAHQLALSDAKAVKRYQKQSCRGSSKKDKDDEDDEEEEEETCTIAISKTTEDDDDDAKSTDSSKASTIRRRRSRSPQKSLTSLLGATRRSRSPNKSLSSQLQDMSCTFKSGNSRRSPSPLRRLQDYSINTRC